VGEVLAGRRSALPWEASFVDVPAARPERVGAAELAAAAVPIAAIAVHLAIALTLRATAWPEVTTPGYLWSRGMLMYRDIKFLHTPGTIGMLALLFAAFGPSTAVVRLFAVAWPLAAHAFLLRETRGLRPASRALASAFFLAVLFSSDGNAVWPTVVIAALALPAARALSTGRFAAGGLLLGGAILCKQTAAYALLLALAWLLARRRVRDAATLLLAASAPYAAALAGFWLAGAGPDMLRWTIGVPFTNPMYRGAFHPPLAMALGVVVPFLPLAAEAVLERPGEYEVSARWLLVLAAGLALICYPRFQVLQTVGAVPALALGAARLMDRRPAALSRLAAAFVVALVVSRGAVIGMGNEFDGRVLFWNDTPAFETLIERLRSLPAATPVYSELWENVYPRVGRVPPGGFYMHPWMDYYFGVDRAAERMAAAKAAPGAVVVGYGRAPGGESVGPFSLVRR